jgi:uncharacterized protein with von Willebrand factor type A (vWA) domain
MADVRALVRVVDELLWSLRREGFVVSTAQAVDVARAVREVGLEQRERVRAAVEAIVVQRARGGADGRSGSASHRLRGGSRKPSWMP